MLIFLQQLTQDIRFGFRTFVRTPGFTTLAVLSLALGIMATTAMYSVIHAVVLDPFPYKDVDALMSVRVWNPEQARVPHGLLHRRVPRDRRAQHDLRRHDRLHHLRRALDRRRRPAAPARQLRHAEHVSGDGRSGAPRPALSARRRPNGCSAGRRTRLPILAASVRRRPERRRPSAPAERHGADRRRGDAEAIHVAGRRRLPADHLRAWTRRRGHQERAPARTAEAGRDRGAGRGRPQADHPGSRAEGRRCSSRRRGGSGCCRSRRPFRAASARTCGCSLARSACCC